MQLQILVYFKVHRRIQILI